MNCLRGLPAEPDGDLSAGCFPQRFDAASLNNSFSFACHFPIVDLDLSDFPNIEIYFGVRKQFVYRGDLVPVVNKVADIIGELDRQFIWLLRLGGLLELFLLFCCCFLQLPE